MLPHRLGDRSRLARDRPLGTLSGGRRAAWRWPPPSPPPPNCCGCRPVNSPRRKARWPARRGPVCCVRPPPPVPDGRTLARAYGEERAGALTATGLFRARDLGRPLRDLSVGQGRRLESALLPAEPVDLLLLDEPTNHVSPALVEELEEALAAYPGTLVTVTHDRRMRAGFTGPVPALPGPGAGGR
ncbi:hypothetical protein [Streptomyces sp. NPDC005805]|uniref:hypothetical protein n=1 Tax=Streptomyces sp. NPDC005805 TaxID=3157068 RepID=UPI0033E9AFEA